MLVIYHAESIVLPLQNIVKQSPGVSNEIDVTNKYNGNENEW